MIVAANSLGFKTLNELPPGCQDTMSSNPLLAASSSIPYNFPGKEQARGLIRLLLEEVWAELIVMIDLGNVVLV
jgi:hypothetical protein